MPTERPTKKRPQAPPPDHLTKAPKGMWYEEVLGRDEPFRARWRMPGGRKQSRAFESARDRAAFAAAWVKRREQFGKDAPMVSPKRVEVWDEFDRRTGGADPLVVADFWLKMRGVAGGNLTVPEAVEKFFSIYGAGRAFSRDTLSHRRTHLKRFADAFPTRRLNTLLPADVRLWLFGNPAAKPAPTPPLLRNPDRADGVFSATSQLHHLRTVSLMFDTLRRERLVDANPCEAVEEPTIAEKERAILTPRQAFDLFAANAAHDVSGPLAVEAFGGLRFSSAARLSLERIKSDSRGIEMLGPEHKSRRRKYREGHPLNLWSWLDGAPASAWLQDEHAYNIAKRAAFVRAGLKPAIIETDEQAAGVASLRNVLRYSFASYLLALTRNAPLVSRLMQHKHTSTTEIYEGVATLADALLFFSIDRATVALSWEQFVAAASVRTADDLMPAA